jgi:hypothetical protein
MSLSTEPVQRFIQRGRRFLENPDVLSGLEFDDAVVVFKRYVQDDLKAPELAYMLGDFASLIRALDSEALKPRFEAVLERLEALGD